MHKYALSENWTIRTILFSSKTTFKLFFFSEWAATVEYLGSEGTLGKNKPKNKKNINITNIKNLKSNFHYGSVEKVEASSQNTKPSKLEKFHKAGEVEKIDTTKFMEKLQNPPKKMNNLRTEKDDVVAFLRRQNRQSPTYQIHLGI